MLATLNALQNFKTAIVVEVNLVNALKLVDDAEALTHHLERGPRASRSRLPPAEEEQAAAVETRNGGDGIGKRGKQLRDQWTTMYNKYGEQFPDLSNQLSHMQQHHFAPQPFGQWKNVLDEVDDDER